VRVAGTGPQVLVQQPRLERSRKDVVLSSAARLVLAVARVLAGLVGARSRETGATARPREAAAATRTVSVAAQSRVTLVVAIDR
jgi:hypothetical protein